MPSARSMRLLFGLAVLLAVFSCIEAQKPGGEVITCTLEGKKLECDDGITYTEEEKQLTPNSPKFWTYAGVCLGLVLFAGLMSGLTMGLLSLDVMHLEILSRCGRPHEQKYARTILPVVKQHHLLLVTLLLCNSAAMESLPIFLDKLVSPILAIVFSVTLILIFGEIVPQAVCTRYGLVIGAKLAGFVKLLMIIMFVLAWPIGKILDIVLGHDHTPFFRKAELKELASMHARDEGPLSTDECTLIKGAIDLSHKTAMTRMTPLDKVYMLPYEAVLDENTMADIFAATHSRIPIYKGDRGTIIGVLLVKRIIQLDPKEATPVKSLHLRQMPSVLKTHPLYDCLNLMQTGKGHMVAVRHAPAADGTPGAIIGIVTLEDIFEALIQEEIYDEVDGMEIQKLLRITRHFREKVKQKVAARKLIEAQQGRVPSSPTVVVDTDTGRVSSIPHEHTPTEPLLADSSSGSH